MSDSAPHIVVIGHTDVGRRSCALLESRGVRITHLDDPTDSRVREALSGPVDGVAVLLHDDMRALRYSLMIEHILPGIRLFVAMFDGTARAQLERTVPNCIVLSPAACSVPSMVAAAISTDHDVIRRTVSSSERSWVTVDANGSSDIASIHPYSVPPSLRVRGIIGQIRGQLHAYDSGSAVLLGGAFGLLIMIVLDTLVGMQHESLIRALYDATRVTATISSPDLGDESWVLAWAALAAVLVMGFTAAFAAGIVHHLISGRHVALVGRRVMPRSGHVVITGMGQVGIRLAQELRSLGVAVAGIERHADAPGLPLARDLGIPVVIGDASSRRVLRRAGLSGSIALVACGSDERDNIAVAISARAVADDVPVVIRAGADDAIDETQSLFHIGSVVDVNGLTAAFVVESMLQAAPYAVLGTRSTIIAVDRPGQVIARLPESNARCGCS